jgi:hypothetical protein
MQNTVKALTALKHSCDALIDNADRASEVQFMTTGNNNVIAYVRSHKAQKCLVVLNLGTSTVNTIVSGLEAGEWKRAIDVSNIADGLTSIPVNFNSTQSFSIPAGGYQVYVKGEPASAHVYGDVNGDKEVNIGDVTALISIIIADDYTLDDLDRVDVNGDREVNVSDVTALISYILTLQ